MSTSVNDLVQRIRDLSGDCEVQRLEIVGLRDDIAQRDEEIEQLKKELAVLTVEPAVKGNGHG